MIQLVQSIVTVKYCSLFLKVYSTRLLFQSNLVHVTVTIAVKSSAQVF